MAADGAIPGRLRRAVAGIAAPGLAKLALKFAAATLVVEVAAGGIAIWLGGAQGAALLAAVLNLLVCLRFAATLLPGRVPLITRYGRCDDRTGLPPEAEGYTRRLTEAWALLLLAFALAHAAVATPVLGAAWTTAQVSAAQGLACAAFFLGEHALRSWRYPQLGRATPWRTLRAVRLCHGGARHAA